jgi:hypothetical protein
MLHRFTIAFIFFIIATVQVWAQKAPGYMGKKIALGVSYDYSPNIAPLILNLEGNNDGEFLNLTPIDLLASSPRIGVFGRFVVGDQKTFDVSINTQGVSYASNYLAEDNSWNGISNYTIEYAKTRTNSLTLGMSNHPQNIAPVGSYYSFGIIFSQTSVSYKEKNNSEETASNFDIGYHGAAGVRRVFKDKIMAEFGINYNLYLGGFFATGQFEGFAGKQENAKNYLKYGYSANAWNNLLVLHLGVAYLL